MALPEINRQVHPFAVFFLYLIPANKKGGGGGFHIKLTSKQPAIAVGDLTELSVKLDLHKDVVFFHDLIEAIITSINFMESVIVNVSHHHLVGDHKTGS